MNKKKILHFITGLEHGGGAENFILKVVPNLKEDENAVCCLIGKGQIGKELEKKGIKVYYLELKSILDIGIIQRYKKVLNDFKPDMQVNYLIHADFFGRIFAKRFGIKKIVSFNRLRYRKLSHKILDRISIGKVDYLLTNSKTTFDDYKRKYNMPRGRMFFIPNAVLLENYNIAVSKIDKRKELGLYEKDMIACCVARLDKQKDHKTLFKALNEANINNLKLILCGDGKEKANLLKIREELGLEDKIIFLGNRKDVIEILKASDIFILPSLYEGMSNALIEAMASKLPCIVSNIDENKELITNKNNGLTFKVGDFKDLAGKIRLLKQKSIRSILGKKAYKTVEKEYELTKVIKRYDKLLKKIQNEKK